MKLRYKEINPDDIIRFRTSDLLELVSFLNHKSVYFDTSGTIDELLFGILDVLEEVDPIFIHSSSD